MLGRQTDAQRNETRTLQKGAGKVICISSEFSTIEGGGVPSSFLSLFSFLFYFSDFGTVAGLNSYPVPLSDFDDERRASGEPAEMVAPTCMISMNGAHLNSVIINQIRENVLRTLAYCGHFVQGPRSTKINSHLLYLPTSLRHKPFSRTLPHDSLRFRSPHMDASGESGD